MEDKLTTEGLVLLFRRQLLHRDFFRCTVFRDCLKFFRVCEEFSLNEVPSVELLDEAILELEKQFETVKVRIKAPKAGNIYSQDHETLETLIQLLWELLDKQLLQHQAG